MAWTPQDPMYMNTQADRLSPGLGMLPRAESMDVVNDPRFIAGNVVAKRLAAFSTIVMVAVLMVTLSVGQMFALEKNITLGTGTGIVQYTGFLLMVFVFLLNLTTVVVLIQQLFMTYRLLTAGATGFEVAKSYYLNPSIVTMRHAAVKGFFFSAPVFVASTSCMIWVSFVRGGNRNLAIPIIIFLGLAALTMSFTNRKHYTIFREQYALAKRHETPLVAHVEAVSQSHRGFFGNLDV